MFKKGDKVLYDWRYLGIVQELVMGSVGNPDGNIYSILTDEFGESWVTGSYLTPYTEDGEPIDKEGVLGYV